MKHFGSLDWPVEIGDDLFLTTTEAAPDYSFCASTAVHLNVCYPWWEGEGIHGWVC